MFADPRGDVWAAVTGETTPDGRARVFHLAAGAAGWRQVYEGPTATDLSLGAAGPGAIYVGFNQPLRAFEPTLLRLDGDRITRLPAPAERLDDLEHLQVGDYAMLGDREGWACGQHGALWRLQGDAWARVPSPFPWAPGDKHTVFYCASITVDPAGDGLMITSDGLGARWDGRAWRPIEPPADDPEVRLYPHGRGLARSERAFYRHTGGGWVRLTPTCDEVTPAALIGRGLLVDRGGALGLTREHVIDFGAASWGCRPSGIDFGLRAIAGRDGALWVLSDDGIHRAAAEHIVTFVPAPGGSLPAGLQYPLVVDLDLDGDNDVIAAVADAEVLPSTVAAHGAPTLWRNLGGGAFQRVAELPPVDLRIVPGQIAAGDLDGDADLDLVTLDVRGELQVWLRDGDRAVPGASWPMPTGGAIDLADLEGDGDLDVFVRDRCLRNDGTGRFTALELPPEAAVHNSAWFDGDGDGDADAIALRWRDPGVYLRNDGDGAFTALSLEIAAEAGTWADLDLDGAPEFLAQRLHYYHLALPFRRCRLGAAPECEREDWTTTPSGIVADLDVDGRPDLVVGSLRVDEQPPRSGEVHLGRAGGFVDVTYASGRHPRPTAFDADGDGDLDLLTVAGGLALQRGAPDTWLRVLPRQAASDRLASGSWVVVRDPAGAVVASGIAQAGVVHLGLPDPDARYAVTVRFPGGATRTIEGVAAAHDLVVHDVEGLTRAARLAALWVVGTAARVELVRDLVAPLALLLAALVALAALPGAARIRPWRRLFAGLSVAAGAAWIGVTVRASGVVAWLLGPLALATAGLITGLVAAAVIARRRVHAGPFRLRERLGAGAAGTVWRAERGGEDLALKLYDADVMASADARERFFREARIGAEIRHPNLVEIVDAGRLDDGRCFVAMKRIDGRSLAALVGGGRLAIDRAIEVAADLAGALAALHRAGVVHRDVKPENVVVGGDGRAVLTDLGLARGVLFRTVTRVDVAVGTLAYMSPEQAIGRPIDGRADLWSLGVVLYELLAGRRPFDGQHEMELIYMLCNVDPPPLRELAPDVDEALAAIVHRCLAREPEARHADAEALRRDLLALRAPASAGASAPALVPGPTH
ncbi:MAG: serine/threonine-protein kinase [Nannocystaceae bacterium]